MTHAKAPGTGSPATASGAGQSGGASSSQAESSEFWEALVLRTLRVAVQIALHGRMDAVTLKRLVDIALYREGHRRGLSLHGMAVAYNCAPRSVKAWAARSRAMSPVPRFAGSLGRVLKALAEKPLTEWELDQHVYKTIEFNASRLALRILRNRCMVEPDNGDSTRWRLSSPWQESVSCGWDAPLTELETRYEIGMEVVSLLTEEPLSLEQLRTSPHLLQTPAESLIESLAFLKELGCITEYLEGTPPATHYRIAMDQIPLIPEDANARLRVGLHALMGQVGSFVDTVMSRRHQSHIGNRSFVFRASPADLQSFIRDHRDWVRAKVIEMESQDCPGVKQPFTIFWAIAPSTDPFKT